MADDGSPVDWAALLLDSERTRRHVVDTAPATDTTETRRGRGRPKGSTGSAAVRRNIAAHTAADAEELACQKPVPGSIEYARTFRHNVKEQLPAIPATQAGAVASILPSSLGMVDAFLKVGTIAQRSMVSAWLHGKNKNPARSSSAAAASEAGATKDVVLDVCLSEKALTCSAQAIANLSSGRATTASTVRSLLLQAGSAVQQMGGWMCGLFFSKLQALCSADDRQEKGIVFVHALRYDETPHSLRISSTSQGQLLMRHGKGQAQDTGMEAWLRDMGIDKSMKELVQCATHAKIMQVEHKMGCLVQDAGGNFAWVTTDVPAGLTAVDRTTGENIRSVLWDHVQLVPEVQRLWQPFSLCVRISTADRAGSNNRAELGLQEPEYMPDFVRASYDCDTHKVANSMKAALRLADADLSGVLNLGLVSGEAGATRTLRAMLIDIFSNDLEIRHRRAPGGAPARHRAAVLDMFVPIKEVSPAIKRRNLKRRFVLNHYLNDDWSLHRFEQL